MHNLLSIILKKLISSVLDLLNDVNILYNAEIELIPAINMQLVNLLSENKLCDLICKVFIWSCKEDQT